MGILKKFFKICPKNKTTEFALERKEIEIVIDKQEIEGKLEEDPPELVEVKEFCVASKGVPGRKSKIKYKVYKDREHDVTIYGITNTMNYIKQNYNPEITKSKVASLTKCYDCNCKFRKAKNYERYNGLEIELLG